MCSLIRIEHFAEENTYLDDKNQEIIDKIKKFNEESTQFENETMALNTKDIPNIQKNIDINEPLLPSCKSKYTSRVQVIKQDEIQKLATDTSKCNQDKVKYVKDQLDYGAKLGNMKFDKMQITSQIDSLRATYKSILDDYEKKQKDLADLKTNNDNVQNTLNNLKNKYDNCIKLKASMPFQFRI